MNKRTVDAAKYSGVSGALGGAMTVIFGWLLSFGGVQVPTEVATAMTVILSFVVNMVLAKTGVISDSE